MYIHVAGCMVTCVHVCLYAQVIYKLTDFGYAKSCDSNSVCTSLVGTMQYVVSWACGHQTMYMYI